MSKKVFELAKELEMGSIDLVEKLRGIGINARNHMVKLSEDELAKVMQHIESEKAAASTTATMKKKVVKKKKVAKKKVAKKATSSKGDSKEESSEEAPKKKATKKKVITVKKKRVAERKEAAKKAKEALEPQNTVQKSEPTPVKLDTDLDEAPMMRKLEVVVPVPEEKKEPVEEGTQAPDKKVYKEKMHTFTPIFVPEKEKESAGATSGNAGERSSAQGQTGATDAKEGEDKGKSKKRIGDLAAIVSKKGGEKSKDLGMIRAEEELKLASTLVGTTAYIPARKKRIYSGETKSTLITEIKDSKRCVRFHGAISARDLAGKLSEKFSEFADKCVDLNLLVKEDDQLGVTLAEEIAALYNYKVENVAFDEKKIIEEAQAKEVDKSLPVRNPIIAVMGHVDHGKTTLLDHIRKEKVVDGEAGGITQHIGAYSVPVKGSTLTFLDTPGHAAFASMRQRGANVTDIVVLVVAADDGVMEQTKESIKFIQRADVPLIVAVNKMDKEGANPDRVKQELMEFSITPEEWGGDVQFIEISALKGDGVDNLLEAIHLQAEIMELRASSKGAAEGIIIESKIETGRGPVCTVLVQKGTLKKGDAIVVGECAGRARSLMDHKGAMLKSAGPSMPVQILGLDQAPSPGDTLNSVKSEREAKKIVDNREQERKSLAQASKKKLSLEDFFGAGPDSEEKKVLKLIVRADVLGSFEAIKNSLEALGNDEVGVEVIGGGAGAISDNDVQMAESVEGYIIGFNMRPVTSARRLAEDKGVDVKTYSIIYQLIDDIKLALEGMLEPERIEKYIGRAQVKNTFNIPKIGVIAGSSVIDGKIQRGCNIRLLREGKIVFDGGLSSLKRFKDDVKEVKNGYECGVALEGYNDIKIDDIFEAYILEEKKRTLESNQQSYI